MRKLFLLCMLLCFGAFYAKNVHADRFEYYWDTKAHDRGQIHFSYGYGFPRLDNKKFDRWKDEVNYRVIGVGPLIFKAEYGLTRQLSLGLSATYIKYTSDFEQLRFDEYHQRNLYVKYGTRVNDIAFMLRLNYHWRITPRSDIYMGGGMGYNIWQVEDFTKYPPEDTTFNSFFKKPSAIANELTIGYRLYFRERNAVYIEAGYGKSIVQAGFVFKFRNRKRE